jgi:hypothetical protein
MTVLFDDMQNRVFSVTRDPNKQFITDEMVENWLNEAQEDLNARLKVVWDVVSGAWATGQTAIELPEDFVEPLYLNLGTTAEDTEIVDRATYQSWIMAGNPPNTIAWLDHDVDDPTRKVRNFLRITPTPTVGTAFEFRYVKRPLKLDRPQDRSQLPDELVSRMVNYARAHAYWQLGEHERGDRYMALYEDGLPTHPLGRQTDKPGPVHLKRDLSFFDRMDGVSHI